ncbi:MAG: SBBP repeat-containing protein [Candidatus Thorarchaeota archaeon]
MNEKIKILFFMNCVFIFLTILSSISTVGALDKYQITYSTFIGGNGTEGHGSLHFDNTSRCWLISNTDSTDFPLKNAIQEVNHGERDAICLKLDKKGEDILYSTYYGGSGDDFVSGSAIDSQGNIIVVGVTSSIDFPLYNALVENISSHEKDVFVFKLSSDGRNVIFSTYLGSASDYYSIDVTTDSTDNIIITGSTIDTNFVINSPYQENKSAGADAFITKITPDGQNVIFSTYFGGSDDDQIKKVTTDKDDNIIVIGVTSSNEQFPIENALMPSKNTTGWDVFLSKFSPDGQKLIFSTFFGGTRPWGPAVVICDSSNSIIACGETNSCGFPLVNAYQEEYGGGELDSFIAKLNPEGQKISFSTFIGGIGSEGPIGIITDSKDNIFLTGSTSSYNFEVRNSYQPQNNGGWDGYLLAFSPEGQDLLFSTYFGGSRSDFSTSIAFLPDTPNSFLITGHGDSRDLTLVNPYQESYGGGDFDLFLCRFELREEITPTSLSKRSFTTSSISKSITSGGIPVTTVGFEFHTLILISYVLTMFLKKKR